MSRDIRVGDWFVIHDYRYVAKGPVVKVTDKTFTGPGMWSSHQSRMSKDVLLFFGTEDVATRLAERLQSSLAMAEDDTLKARGRHAARKALLVEKAAADRDELAREGSVSGMNPKGGPA